MDAINEDMKARLRETLAAALSEETLAPLKKKLRDALCDVESDLQYSIESDLAWNLTAHVSEMAKRTVEAILSGNQQAMERYLGCESGHWTGRSDSPQFGRTRAMEEWHSVIHGKLFEQGAVALRKQIVAAHRDLIESQRILDLEDQVASLVAQINKHTAEIERLRNERYAA